MSFLFITLPAAVIPALVLVWYFVKSDKYPEPVSMILKTFFYGILIVIPILFFANLVYHSLPHSVEQETILGVFSVL